MKAKNQWVFKPGTFERKQLKKNQPGLDLTRAMFDVLKDHEFAVTKNCCDYFPSIPVITEDERAEGIIPDKGLVLIYDEGNDEYDLVYINSEGTEYRAVALLPLAV